MVDPTTLLWPVFKAQGMLVEAVVSSLDTPPVETTADVRLNLPDLLLGTGALSRDYEIEFQAADLPDLDEGHQVVIGGDTYRVRESPYIPENQPSGFFMRAKLTKV
jgi:hypothetical protein